MTDDIVTRLRLLSASQKAHRFGDLMEDWSGEAADEIERLRAEYEHCRLQMLMYQRIAELGPQAVTNEHD